MRIMKEFDKKTATLLPDEGEVLASVLPQVLADVTVDADITTVVIDVPESSPAMVVDTLLHSGFKVHRWTPGSFTMIRELRH